SARDTAGAVATKATSLNAASLFLMAIERDIVDIDVGLAHGGAERDRVDGLQIHVGRALAEPDLSEFGKRQCVELPIGRKLHGLLPAVLAAIVAAGRGLIALVPAVLAALVGGGERVGAAR